MYGTNVTNKLQFTFIYNTTVAIGTVWSGGSPAALPAGQAGRSPPPAPNH